jgi:hypothetical protein
MSSSRSEEFEKLVLPLLRPERLFSAGDVLQRPSPVPARPGVYAWYFREVPPRIAAERCHKVGDHTLLYVGISPKADPTNGRPPSRSTLRQRLRTHFSGNAEGSTLRRTLGCLLGPQLGIALRRVGSGTRYTFTNPGERELDTWMAKYAFVTWVETKEPWRLEAQLLGSDLLLPLNIEGNPRVDAITLLREIRSEARRTADQLPIVEDNGGPRRA